MKKHICVISLALPIETDPRTSRQVEYLSRKYSVTLIGFGNPSANWSNVTWKPINRHTGKIRLIIELLLLVLGRFLPGFYEIWLRTRPRYRQALIYAIESKADAYHASDWATLYIAGEASRRCQAKLVFDADEYWPLFDETSKLWMLFFSPVIRYVLKKYSHDVDMTINVSEPIAQRYKAEYNLDYLLVYNVPELQIIHPHPIKPDRIRIIHHGGAIKNRQLEIMIKAVPFLQERFTLDLLLAPSEPEYLENLKILAQQVAPNRITFHKPVKVPEVVKYIAEFDVGLCFIAPTTYNWEMAMPNKLFEYVVGGLAVVSGPSPAISQFIKDYNVGWVAPSFSPEDLAKTLNSLTLDQIEKTQQATQEVAKVFNAETEIGKILLLFENLFTLL